jgi:NAD(P)-dependent dehydrogenase (short-subunit alcohol dehydrogenase family)
VLAVNLLGPWRLSRAVWPQLVASGDGRMITLVSMSGRRVKGGLAAYSASKFALMGLCQTMRNEGWQAGIRITAICPSWVNTSMAAAVTALAREAMTQPDDLAASVSHLLSLPASAVPFEFNVSCQLEQ